MLSTPIFSFVRRAAGVVVLAGWVSAASGCSSILGAEREVTASLFVRLATNAGVTLLVVEVSAPDIDRPLVFNLEMSEGMAEGQIAMPVGLSRLISISGFDATGLETHRGSKSIDVVAGTNPTVELVLEPVLGDVPVVVTIGSIAVIVEPAQLSIDVGASAGLTARVTNASGEPVEGAVSWATLDPGVAVVSPNGLVTGVAEGETRIVAVYAGVASSAIVRVSPVPPAMGEWTVSERDSIVEFGWGALGHFPQFIALHLDSGYLRMIYSETAEWSTSMIIPPSYWSGGVYYQGAPVTYTWTTEGSDLVLVVSGRIGTLDFTATIRFAPPANDILHAAVSMQVSGTAVVDVRPGESFKLAMMSSMHVSDNLWDSESAYVGEQTFSVPGSGWLIPAPVAGTVWGLRGGTSDWKTNAPTVEVRTAEPYEITGWVTPTSDPNNDNVGMWAASDAVVPAWTYEMIVKP